MMTNHDEARELLERGMSLHRSGELWAAIDCYRRSIEINPESGLAYNYLGGALANIGDTEAAEAALQQAIEKDPSLFDPHLHLAKLKRIGGQLESAGRLLKRAIELDERNYQAWMEFGAVFSMLNRFGRAAECFEKALAINPRSADALHNLGRVAFEIGRESRAVIYYRKALQRNPEMAACHTNLGIALRALGELDEAQEAFEKALSLEPRQAEAVNGLVGMLELEGSFDEALERLESAIKKSSDPLLQLSAARIERRMNRFAAAIERMHRLEDRMLDNDMRMQREFILGDLCDESQQYDEAWAHYNAANKLKGVEFSPSAYTERVNKIIEAFTPNGAKEGDISRETYRKPVFIVGMPRSGTSLLEQVLASHPQVYGAGELTTLATLVGEIPLRINGAAPYPQCMRALSPRRLKRLAAVYMDKLDSLAPDSQRVTDKMWLNFEYLGLIERMLPGARVIHCRRDPLDTGLSCYFQNFAGQMGVPFSYNLEHIGAFYREYQRLMDHWSVVCGLSMFELKYESLVTKPDETSKSLIEFLDLPWDDACLDFHKNRRPVNTASVAQARMPIYTKSIARHRHYEQHLEPLRTALGL